MNQVPNKRQVQLSRVVGCRRVRAISEYNRLIWWMLGNDDLEFLLGVSKNHQSFDGATKCVRSTIKDR